MWTSLNYETTNAYSRPRLSKPAWKSLDLPMESEADLEASSDMDGLELGDLIPPPPPPANNFNFISPSTTSGDDGDGGAPPEYLEERGKFGKNI